MATSRMFLVSVVAILAVSAFRGAAADSRADAIAFAQTASTTLSTSNLPRDLIDTYLPACKQLNTDTCGTTQTSVWKFPSCCPTSANFSSSSRDVATDCSFLSLPYSASNWKCDAGTVKSCCKEVICSSYFVSYTNNANGKPSSCTSDLPESICCPSSLKFDTCQTVRSGTTATCQSLGTSYSELYCCPAGTSAVYTSRGASITAALLSQGTSTPTTGNSTTTTTTAAASPTTSNSSATTTSTTPPAGGSSSSSSTNTGSTGTSTPSSASSLTSPTG